MSSVAWSMAPSAAGGTLRAIEPAQHAAAKTAGVAYLVTTSTAVFADFFARGSLVAGGDAAETASNILASERLFRIGAAANVVTFAGAVVLVVALYAVLGRVGRPLALLAAFSRLAECIVLGAITSSDFAALSLLGGGDYLGALDTRQIEALAYTFVRAHGAGYQIGIVFYGLGSGVFAWLWLKSRYVPRVLAALGLFSASAAGAGMLAAMLVPGLGGVVMAVSGPPGLVFELGLGLWLVVRGIRPPAVAADGPGVIGDASRRAGRDGAALRRKRA